MKSATAGEKKQAAEGEGDSIQSSGGLRIYPATRTADPESVSGGYSTRAARTQYSFVTPGGDTEGKQVEVN